MKRVMSILLLVILLLVVVIGAVFVSSGPGTSDYFYNEAYPEMNLF